MDPVITEMKATMDSLFRFSSSLFQEIAKLEESNENLSESEVAFGNLPDARTYATLRKATTRDPHCRTVTGANNA